MCSTRSKKSGAHPAPGPTHSLSSSTQILLGAVGTAVVFGSLYKAYDVVNGNTRKLVDTRPENLPRFCLSEVRKHDAQSKNIWVTHEDKVYDITDWVEAHPGGDIILRAAGTSIEPYWDIFSIHKTSYAREVLAQYLIGYVDIEDLGPDGKPVSSEVEDPFADDPVRDFRLHTVSAKPRSAEAPLDDLTDHFLTPTRTFFIRNHMWVPSVDQVDKHECVVELPDGSQKTYSVAELKSKFKNHRITAALQCSGNRRSHMTAVKQTNGLQWGVGAISNAEWEGVKLSDVLADAAGADPKFPSGSWNQEALFGDAKHVWFSGLEAYGASIPLATAFDPRSDVLLAFGMNGEPLPRDHGSPLRALVPGHVAARSVKFLSKITVAEEESPTQWQRRDYKCFGPNQVKDLDWDSAPAIQEMPVTSAITRVTIDSPRRWKVNGETGGTKVNIIKHEASSDDKDAKPSRINLRGYGYSGGGREIVRVDISLDGGQTWGQARLLDNCNTRHATAKAAGEEQSCKGSKYWAWKRWEFDADIPDGKQETSNLILLCKATDDSYNTQPQEFSSIYNPRGNLACAWHKLTVSMEGKDEEKRKIEHEQDVGGEGKEKKIMV